MSRILVIAAMCGTAVAGVSVTPALARAASGPTQSYSSMPIPLPTSSVTGRSVSGPSASKGPDAASSRALETRSVSGNSGRQLPFTGVDIRVILLAGIVLFGTGLVLRRGSRTEGSAPPRAD